MENHRLTIEQILWVLVLALAFGMRLFNLGVEPLSDLEAGWALQALSLFPGTSNIEALPPGSQTAYITLTGLFFSVLGSSDAIARLLPAIAGGLLCLLPYFFRFWIGRNAALIMALGLALDPGLVAISRLAGGPMPALSFLLLGLGLLTSGKVILSGVALGLVLLSGPPAWQGLLIVVITGGLVSLAEKAGWISPASDTQGEVRGIFPPISTWKAGLISAGLTVLVVGTLFGRFPQGLGSMSVSLPEYLLGWASARDISAAHMLAVFLAYQPLAIIFGTIGGVRSWLEGNPFAQRVTIFMLVALGAVLIYPARQVGDLIWVLVPLWGVASIELSRYLDIETNHRAIVFGQAALVFVMLSLFWLNLAGFTLPVPDQRSYLLRTGILLGVVFLVGLSTVLLGYGWTWKAAIQGLVWGLVAVLCVYQIAGIWNSARPVTAQVLNIWQPSPQAAENNLFMQTVADLSEWSTGRAEQIDVVVAVDAPSMRWSFRNFPNATFIPEQEALALRESPSLIITRVEQQTPALAASYRGQDLPWWRVPGWVGALPQPLPKWIAYRQNPASQSSVILWARADLFVDQSTPASDVPIPLEEEGIPLQEDLPQ